MLKESILFPSLQSVSVNLVSFVGHVKMTNQMGFKQTVGVFDTGNGWYISGPHAMGDCWIYHRIEYFTPLFWATHRVYRYACPTCGKSVYPPFEMASTTDLADFLKPYGGCGRCNNPLF